MKRIASLAALAAVFATSAVAEPLTEREKAIYSSTCAHFDNRVELEALEDRIAYLDRVRLALKTNPGFATELARLDQQTARPGESRLAVDRSLQLVPRLQCFYSRKSSMVCMTTLAT